MRLEIISNLPDDIALILKHIDEAQSPLLSVENEAADVRLL